MSLARNDICEDVISIETGFSLCISAYLKGCDYIWYHLYKIRALPEV